jgi:EAL domain-containing protein (putative c-di-GMP-specific phosphodiesterase class I)
LIPIKKKHNPENLPERQGKNFYAINLRILQFLAVTKQILLLVENLNHNPHNLLVEVVEEEHLHFLHQVQPQLHLLKEHHKLTVIGVLGDEKIQENQQI